MQQPEFWMEKETEESASIIENQQKSVVNVFQEITKRLLENPPHFVATLARGSSDHASFFAKYAIETQLGIMTASITPSIHTIYKTNLNYKNSLVIAISQSGKSKDLIESLVSAKKNGAVTLSFVNDANSELAKESEYFIPLLANTEKSVAATKSFIASLSRIIQFVSYWKNNSLLNLQILNTAKQLSFRFQNHQNEFTEKLMLDKSIFIIGRGYSFPIALESALKLKETCGLHAEAFSGAEILHGPFELIQSNFPILVYLSQDETLNGMLNLIDTLKNKNAKLFIITTNEIATIHHEKLFHCVVVSAGNSVSPLCDSILFIYHFYKLTIQLAQKLGRNPDTPKNLNKVTSTI